MKAIKSWVFLMFAAAFLFHSISGWSKEILVGHVAGYSGPVAANVRDLNLGAKILFDAINDQGGLGGNKIRIVTADDKYNAENTPKLVSDMAGKVSALLPIFGPRNLQLTLSAPELAGATLPIVGSIPSKENVAGVGSRNLFHIRASDPEQVEKIIQHLITIGVQRIGLIEYRNPNRPDGAGEVELILREQLKKRGLQPAGIGQYDLKPNPDFDQAIRAITDNSPQAVIVYGPPLLALHPLLKNLQSRNIKLPIYSLSYMDAKALAQDLGDYAKYVVIVQVFPNIRDTSLPLIKEFRANFRKYGQASAEPNFWTLEGYISAKLIVEAMRLSQDNSAQGVRNGLEMMRNLDLGGYVVDFSQVPRRGSHFTTLSIVGKNGDLRY